MDASKCQECESTLTDDGRCCNCEMVQGKCEKCGDTGISIWEDSGLCVTCEDAAAADNGDGGHDCNSDGMPHVDDCVVCQSSIYDIRTIKYYSAWYAVCEECEGWLQTLNRPTTDSQWLEQHAIEGIKWIKSSWRHREPDLDCPGCDGVITYSGYFYHDSAMDNVLCPGCWLKRDDTPLAFEHGNVDDNHKVPTYIIIDKIKYMAERTDHGHIMQLMLRCNCEVGFGDDTDLVVHTLYAVEAKGEENISVCLMCNTLIYGRGHSKHSTPPALTAEQAAVLERIRRGEFLMSSVDMRVELCHYLLDTELIIVNTIIDVDEPMYLITLAGHAALEAWQAKQKPTIEELDDKILVPTPDECSATEQTQHCACGTEITGPANYRAAIDDDDIELVALCDSCEATAAADYKARIDATLKLTESCDSKQLEADEPTLGNTKCIVCSKLVGGDCQCDHLAKQIEHIGNLDNAPVLGARDTTPKQRDDIEVQSIETDEPPPKPKATKAKKKRKTKTPCAKCESKTRKIVEDGKCWECCGYPGRAQMLDIIYDVLGWSKTKTMYGKKNMAHMTRLAQWGATLENLLDYADWMKRYYEKKDWTLVMGSFNKEDMWQTFNAKSNDDDDGLPFGNAPLFADPIPTDPAIVAEAAALSKEEVAALEIKVRKQITGK